MARWNAMSVTVLLLLSGGVAGFGAEQGKTAMMKEMQVERVNGVTWIYEVTEGTATLLGLTPINSVVTIPSTLAGFSVSRIGDCAFNYSGKLTEVQIPDSVTSIGVRAFIGCSKLRTITIPDGVTTIGTKAFFECLALEEVVIGNSVRDIGDYAFHNCIMLKSINIPNNATNIGRNAFSECMKQLRTLSIGNGVTCIGDYAFYDCTCLEEITIGNSVETIGDWAFAGCTSLTNVIIPDGVSNIGVDAFGGCIGVKQISIGNGVKTIGSSAFCGCSNAVTIDLPNGLVSIEASALSSCGFEEVRIPNSVTNIGYYAFAFCHHLKTLFVPVSWEMKYVNGVLWNEYARVPDSCTIVYVNPAVPQSTSLTPVPVPYAWLAANAGKVLETEGGNYEAAAMAKAANGLEVWECYVAGVSTTNAGEKLSTTISFSNGVPRVSWFPDLNDGGRKSERSYMVEGKESMADEWKTTNAASRFFRVKVALPSSTAE